MIEANPAAKEIYQRFNAKMAKGGEIDQILNGREPIQKRPAEPDHVLSAMRRNIDQQLEEYGQDLVEYGRWVKDWRNRQPKGFRIKRTQRQSA